MDVKEFFYNGGCVQRKDRTESDVIIDIVKEAGFSVYDDHDPDGCYHAVLLEEGDTMITFARNGGRLWCNGTPFAEWMEQYVRVAKPTPVEDLI